MTPDPRDAALQATCPCVAVPRFRRLPPAGQGQRVLVARNGVFAEVTPFSDFRSFYDESIEVMMGGGLGTALKTKSPITVAW